ncbi:tail fiber domain-containing protein [Winogradskyella sp. SM1960]|uniref:tail fiber domain-containing protein n=1 Tax=Winogradskyella sp. SM1960 TaxID=2865955 RepID=UPI001CD2C1BB|nr:tail fiber domain-containing protein [Winogradskyella sp. SM1960]
MKKNIITLVVSLLITVSTFAQQGINYKALIKDDLGNVLAEQDVTLRFTIFESNNDYYQETHSTTTDDNGIVIINIGEGTPTGIFSNLPWHYINFSLRVEIDITGGTSFVDMGSTPFLYVPYAKYAERVNVNNIHIGVNDLNDGKSDGNGYSIFLGHGAGIDDDGGNFNTSLGYLSLYSNTSGVGNVAIGPSALQSNLIGNGNIAIGRSAGISNTGNDNVFIGNSAGTNPSNGDNKLYINNGQSSNPLIYGEFDTNLIRINGTLDVTEEMDIGGPLTIKHISDATSSWRLETRPNGSLSLYRNGSYRGFFSESTGNYSSISDRRTKKDITALDNGTLNKVMQLNPVSYVMKDQKDTKRNLGLISQEVQKIFPSITNYVEEADLITLSYTELIPILIKALQEQQGIIDGQNTQIETLSADNSSLKTTLNDLILRVEKIEANNQ